uniref:MADF domain-containing protein n=1 Tax=Anopheles farauti TaxID=69004 RepID=A0A182QMP0_9DIPT
MQFQPLPEISTLSMDDEYFTRAFARLMKHYPQLHHIITKSYVNDEWHKVARRTGHPASALMHKWYRMRDSYRADLRRQLEMPPEEFEPKWRLFNELYYLREIELKRIRPRKPSSELANTRKRKVQMPKPMPVPLLEIKQEPASPPRRYPLSTPVFEQKLPLQSIVKQEYTVPVKKESPVACKPSLPPPSLQQAPMKIEAGRNYCVQTPQPEAKNIMYGVDMDYDFLLTRIYPYLSSVPLEYKQELYSRMQKQMYCEFKRVQRIVHTSAGTDDSIMLTAQSKDDAGK